MIRLAGKILDDLFHYIYIDEEKNFVEHNYVIRWKNSSWVFLELVENFVSSFLKDQRESTRRSRRKIEKSDWDFDRVLCFVVGTRWK